MKRNRTSNQGHRFVQSRWLDVLLLCFGVVGCLCACATKPPRAPYPHESILTVIAELKIQLNKDPYKFAPGTDLEGANIYRVSLTRLKALESLAGDNYADVLAYAEGECYERLGSWGDAGGAFRRAAARGTSIAADSSRRAGLDDELTSATTRGGFARTLQGYFNDLTVLDRSLAEWTAAHPEWPYASLAKLERQHGLEETARLNFTNRMVMPDALAHAFDALKRLDTEFADSYRHSDDLLVMGSYYETLARDWAAAHPPETPEFGSDKAWPGWIEEARQAYRRVAEIDGDPAKLEGQARLRALEAYALRVQAAAR